MGSTGTGRFGDYKGNGSDISKCDTPLRQVRLEEVSTIEYYVRNQSIAPMDTDIQLREKLYNGRIAVEETISNLVIGVMPTKYNYLLLCMKSGKQYVGKITVSTNSPFPLIEVDLDAAS